MLSRLSRLTRHDGGTRLRIVPCLHTNRLPQEGSSPLLPPETEIVVHGRPQGRILGQHAPSIGTAEPVAYGLEKHTAGRTATASWIRAGRIRRQGAALALSQIDRLKFSVVQNPFNTYIGGMTHHFSDSFLSISDVRSTVLRM
jgi:hypothetical protein